MPKILRALLCLGLCVLLAGCGSAPAAGELGEDQLLSVGEAVCTRGEATVFLLSQRSLYSRDFGDRVWDVTLESGSFRDAVMEALLDYLEMLFLVDEAARQAGIRLSEAEQAEVNRAANSFLSALTGEQLEQLGFGRQEVVNAYSRFARVQIYYRQVMQQAVSEISQEEARAVRLQIIQLDRAQGMQRAQEAAERLKSGEKLSAVMKDFPGMSSRQETVIRGSYDEPFDSFAFSLKTNQWTTVITLPDGYYILQCLSPCVEEDTAKNKAAMELALKERLLDEALEHFAEGKTLKFNPRVWEGLSLEALEGLPLVNFYDYTEALLADY